MTSFGAILTIIFAVLKVVEVGAPTDWSWLQVALPLIIGVAIDFAIWLLFLFGILSFGALSSRGRRR